MSGTQQVNVIAVEAGTRTAGMVTWWSLSGAVALDDLAEAWDAEGFDAAHLPSSPTAETALHRAAMDCQDKRTLVRPLNRRGMWDVVAEAVLEDEHGAPRTVHSQLCRVELRPDKTPVVVPEDAPQAARILNGFRLYRRVLTPADISAWLSEMVYALAQGVSLRDRGGMYFIPATHAETWRRLARALQAASKHTVFEMPALQTDKAVEAILVAVRADAEERLAAMEAYMAKGPDGTSTRGLNAYARQAAAVQAKLAHYAALLGVALPDLTERAEVLMGAITAAALLAKAAS